MRIGVLSDTHNNKDNLKRALEIFHNTLLALNPDNFAGDVFSGRLGNATIAATHGHIDGKVEELVNSGRYAYVCHGHSHRRRDDMIGQTRIINPGALGGMRRESRSVCLLGLDGGTAQFIEVAS